jgi:hypothetical protein
LKVKGVVFSLFEEVDIVGVNVVEIFQQNLISVPRTAALHRLETFEIVPVLLRIIDFDDIEGFFASVTNFALVRFA